MSRPLRVAMVVSSVRNPFVEAWVRLLSAAGLEVVLLLRSSACELLDLPDDVAARTVWSALGGPLTRDDQNRCEALLGGRPDVLYTWWGFGSLPLAASLGSWATLPNILCVDTFPNAAFFATELREALRANLRSPKVQGIIATSPEMVHSVASVVPALHRVPSVVVPSPFSIQAHARTHARRPGTVPRALFIGRSDYLFADRAQMAKDAVGPWLESLIRSGWSVSVQRPSGSPEMISRLTELGFDLYEPFARSAITDGTFADFMAGFDANLAMYAVVNGTIRRRVANGLSTRFANALCAPAPIVVPADAKFAKSYFQRRPLGVLVDRPQNLVRMTEDLVTGDRSYWVENHAEWAGEKYCGELREIFEKVASGR